MTPQGGEPGTAVPGDGTGGERVVAGVGEHAQQLLRGGVVRRAGEQHEQAQGVGGGHGNSGSMASYQSGAHTETS